MRLVTMKIRQQYTACPPLPSNNRCEWVFFSGSKQKKGTSISNKEQDKQASSPRTAKNKRKVRTSTANRALNQWQNCFAIRRSTSVSHPKDTLSITIGHNFRTTRVVRGNKPKKSPTQPPTIETTMKHLKICHLYACHPSRFSAPWDTVTNIKN